MIESAKTLTQSDIEAYKQAHGFSGSIRDGDPRLAWHLLPLMCAVAHGVIRTDKHIEF